MIDNSNYITVGFKKTVNEWFSDRAKELSDEYDKRLAELLDENKDASKEKMLHLKAQILPGIAAYEVLRTIMSKEAAYDTIHGYTEKHAIEGKIKLEKILRIPGLYRIVPRLFAKMVRKIFNEDAGSRSYEYKTKPSVWRIDMLECPYYNTCKDYGCAELCTCFCDSDDVSYGSLHKNLIWHRTQTLGRGDKCCDFCLKVRGGESLE